MHLPPTLCSLFFTFYIRYSFDFEVRKNSNFRNPTSPEYVSQWITRLFVQRYTHNVYGKRPQLVRTAKRLNSSNKVNSCYIATAIFGQGQQPAQKNSKSSRSYIDSIKILFFANSAKNDFHVPISFFLIYAKLYANLKYFRVIRERVVVVWSGIKGFVIGFTGLNHTSIGLQIRLHCQQSEKTRKKKHWVVLIGSRDQWM